MAEAQTKVQRKGLDQQKRSDTAENFPANMSGEPTQLQTQSANEGKGKQPKSKSQLGTEQKDAPPKAGSSGLAKPQDSVSFNKEALLILREMNSNITKTNTQVQELASRMDALYDYNENYDEEHYDDENVDHSREDTEEVTVSKRPLEDDTSIFSTFAKKFKKSDITDNPVNEGLADLVNSAFLDGMSEDNYSDIIKNIHRPENCDSLKERRVNPGVWSVLRAQTQTEDSKLRGIQNCIVKASCNITKLMDAQAENLDESSLEMGMHALGLLGQANKWLNIRRRESHKKDMDPKLHHLCSSSVPYTDLLYGDSIVKDIRDIQEMNKISKSVGTARHTNYRGRSTRGARFPRNRGRGIGRRGGYRFSTHTNQSQLQKNGKLEQTKQKSQ